MGLDGGGLPFRRCGQRRNEGNQRIQFPMIGILGFPSPLDLGERPFCHLGKVEAAHLLKFGGGKKTAIAIIAGVFALAAFPFRFWE